ncbi:Blue-light-activated histidine kinase 1 (EL360-LOV-histidine kinase) (EL360-LOV-HK) [Durusdinium trenchii]|uniref:Blue-light-activated histidine kinase 1 (EL360-LOV-histidine kinase) (EL360-LOV-HK) n=1 Tax=Durusdinium trenchii TaxID=1381693 RepID=A0ABP0RQ66_9DINO|eukprot:g10842.t1
MAMPSEEPILGIREPGMKDDFEDDGTIGALPHFSSDGRDPSFSRQESSHGPLRWNTRCSTELQNVIDTFFIEELYELGFSVTLADPSKADCPLIACSAGFTELTGYSVQEIVGRNCRFLLNGVPSNLIDDTTRVKCRAFCMSSTMGEEYTGASENLPEGLQKPWVELPKGEMICVQTNARKSGELFRNMFYLKQVELDEAQYILGLQAGLPEEFDLDVDLADLEKRCHAAFSRLEENMTLVEQVLAQQFWYSAPMRRQL